MDLHSEADVQPPILCSKKKQNQYNLQITRKKIEAINIKTDKPGQSQSRYDYSSSINLKSKSSILMIKHQYKYFNSSNRKKINSFSATKGNPLDDCWNREIEKEQKQMMLHSYSNGINKEYHLHDWLMVSNIPIQLPSIWKPNISKQWRIAHSFKWVNQSKHNTPSVPFSLSLFDFHEV